MRFDKVGNLVLDTQPEVQALTSNRALLSEPDQAQLNSVLVAQEAIVAFPYSRCDQIVARIAALAGVPVPETRVHPNPEFTVTPDLSDVTRRAVEATLNHSFYKISRQRQRKIVSAAHQLAGILETSV